LAPLIRALCYRIFFFNIIICNPNFTNIIGKFFFAGIMYRGAGGARLVLIARGQRV
jgi:hypothetical protein